MTFRMRRPAACAGVTALALSLVLPVTAASAAPVPDFPIVGSSANTINPTVYTMDEPIYRVTHANGNTLLTPWESEARNAVENLGWDRYELAFYASTTEQPNSEPVHRLYNPQTGTFLTTNSSHEVAKSTELGFQDVGVSFWVPAWDMRGTYPIHRMHKVVDGVWRYRDVLGTAGVDEAMAQGWVRDAAVYRAVGVTDDGAEEAQATPAPKPTQTAKPAPKPSTAPGAGDGDGAFTFVQINDTQEDVWPDSRKRFDARVDWILANEDARDIRFAAHTGDLVNWWETSTNHRQHRIAADALAPLIASDIPFAAAVGNHDTLAVADGAGWDNRDENGKSRAYWGLRQTDLINDFFPSSSFRNMRGQMEAGKFDNAYHTFQAEGADFLVLAVELYPRQKAVNWAKKVIEQHPDHNVILLQHSYLGGWGGLMGTSEYGDLTPYDVQRQLVDPYRNVKMVLSGHVGETAHQAYTTPKGNEVLYVVTNMSKNRQGPVRTFDIDVPGDHVATEIVHTVDGTAGHHAYEADIDWIE